MPYLSRYTGKEIDDAIKEISNFSSEAPFLSKVQYATASYAFMNFCQVADSQPDYASLEEAVKALDDYLYKDPTDINGIHNVLWQSGICSTQSIFPVVFRINGVAQLYIHQEQKTGDTNHLSADAFTRIGAVKDSNETTAHDLAFTDSFFNMPALMNNSSSFDSCRQCVNTLFSWVEESFSDTKIWEKPFLVLMPIKNDPMPLYLFNPTSSPNINDLGNDLNYTRVVKNISEDYSMLFNESFLNVSAVMEPETVATLQISLFVLRNIIETSLPDCKVWEKPFLTLLPITDDPAALYSFKPTDKPSIDDLTNPENYTRVGASTDNNVESDNSKDQMVESKLYFYHDPNSGMEWQLTGEAPSAQWIFDGIEFQPTTDLAEYGLNQLFSSLIAEFQQSGDGTSVKAAPLPLTLNIPVVGPKGNQYAYPFTLLRSSTTTTEVQVWYKSPEIKIGSDTASLMFGLKLDYKTGKITLNGFKE